MLCATSNALDPSPSTASLFMVLFVPLLRAPCLLGSPSTLPEAVWIHFCHSAYPITAFLTPLHAQGFLVVSWPNSVTNPHNISQDKPFYPGGHYKSQNTDTYVRSSQIRQEKKRSHSPSSVIISAHGWTTIHAIFFSQVKIHILYA